MCIILMCNIELINKICLYYYGNAVIKFPIKYASHMNIVERIVTMFLIDFMYLQRSVIHQNNCIKKLVLYFSGKYKAKNNHMKPFSKI